MASKNGSSGTGAAGDAQGSGRAKRRSDGRTAGGRVTPKGGPVRTHKVTTSVHAAAPSTRYTPPTQRLDGLTPRWVPFTMIGGFVLGFLVIFMHYVNLLLPGASSNWWLLGGLGLILGGIISATQYR
jgi:Cell division protein CrgA